MTTENERIKFICNFEAACNDLARKYVPTYITNPIPHITSDVLITYKHNKYRLSLHHEETCYYESGVSKALKEVNKVYISISPEWLNPIQHSVNIYELSNIMKSNMETVVEALKDIENWIKKTRDKTEYMVDSMKESINAIHREVDS